VAKEERYGQNYDDQPEDLEHIEDHDNGHDFVFVCSVLVGMLRVHKDLFHPIVLDFFDDIFETIDIEQHPHPLDPHQLKDLKELSALPVSIQHIDPGNQRNDVSYEPIL
jgi:hypothetical protein